MQITRYVLAALIALREHARAMRDTFKIEARRWELYGKPAENKKFRDDYGGRAEGVALVVDVLTRAIDELRGSLPEN